MPERKLHLYHCDHRGLPLALISPEGETAWSAEYDEWGNLLNEDNPQSLKQLIRLPGQQYDDESGLYYNRNRYYDPLQGRYITQDPIGLNGGWNLYSYPLNPVQRGDPLGLAVDAIPWDAANPSMGVGLASAGEMLAAGSETLFASGAEAAMYVGPAIVVVAPMIYDYSFNNGEVTSLIGEGQILKSQMLMDAYPDPGGIFASIFGDDKNSEKPNVSKGLTNEEKSCLGGVSTGGPGGGGGDPNEDDGIKNTYRSIKDAPQYPREFRNVQNGTTRNVVKDQSLLKQLRKVESGKWSKVYRDGFDASGRKISVHYFESQSGRVFNVK
ncbi:RHS repeat protein [Salmonella enterica subsp. enterica]|nr:RHS repeat protein [Salmonella enterica subsp. enterica]